jgi:hypothetical protein
VDIVLTSTNHHMSISPWIIYLWGIADQLRPCLGVASLFFIFYSLIMRLVSGFAKQDAIRKRSCAYGTSKEREEAAAEELDVQSQNDLKTCKRAWAVGVALFGAATMFPSSKTIALMVVIPALLNSEPIQKDLPELYQMAKDALKQTLVTE